MKEAISLNKIYQEDCLSFIPRLPDKFVDIIITDPPYAISSGNKLFMINKQNKNGFGGDWSIINEEWDKFSSLDDYCHLIKKMMKESYRVLKPTGTAFIFGTYHNIGIINYYALKIGFNIINEVIWFKRNAFPNLTRKCLTASHENILWLSKSDSWNYNYEEMRKAKYSFDKIKEEGKQLRSVWDIPNNKQKDELSYRDVFPDKSFWVKSQKPVRLIDRCLAIAARPGYIVADWFCGSGTTLLSASNNSLPFVGCEINSKYVEVIKWRLKNTNKVKNY